MANAGMLQAPFNATGLPAAPGDGAYRLKTDANGTFLQLKAPTGEWASVFVKNENGALILVLGPAE